MIKVLHVVGARPQFMKLLPLYLEMSKNQINQEILHTGQHFDEIMSDVFFSQLEIPKPNYNLNINNLSHGAMTGRMIEEIEKILLNKSYEFLIIYGDTNSTLAGAISAKKMGVKIIHIESGVRNYDPSMPEETNRILSDRISDLLFCNSNLAINNLKKEGFELFESKIILSGDLMFDCLKIFESRFIIPNYNDYILVTCHRASNTEKNNLENIIDALNSLSHNHKIIFPIHPRTKKIIEKYNLKLNFSLSPPQDYFCFMGLIKNAKFIITDSGGLIREAYWMKKKSMLLLEKPLWPELVESNVSINCQPIKSSILSSFSKLSELDFVFPEGILGDGKARSIIVNSIINYEQD